MKRVKITMNVEMQVTESEWKKDFPILAQRINGKPLVYLDSAATSQKPSRVIDEISRFYQHDYSNVHRGMNTLSEKATDCYEEARKKVARFINASPEEIIFVRNATEGLNLIARTFGVENVKEGNTILLTEMEHHSNLVPWQLLCKEKNAKLEFVPVTDQGELDLEEAQRLLQQKPALFSFAHVSNALGTINPVKELVQMAHKQSVKAILDAAQSAPHIGINVKDLDIDFLVMSGHKMFSPSGIGLVYGKKNLLEKMPPFIAGGDMIKEVSFFEATWNDLPWKFEAGTPNISGAVGLGVAIDYMENIGMKKIQAHNYELTRYAYGKLSKLPYVKIYGPEVSKRNGVISFNVGDAHPHDVASILDAEGIEIRSGHMCAQPLLQKIGVESMCRVSFQIYNSQSDVDVLVSGLEKVAKVFKL